MEVLDLTADVSGGEDIEVNITSQISYFKIRFEKREPCLRTTPMLEDDVHVGGPLW